MSREPGVEETSRERGSLAAGGTEGAAPGRRAWPRIAAGLLLLLALLLLARSAGDRLPAVAAWLETLGFWGPLAFVAVYVAATVLFVPGALMTLAGGALFGLAEGTLYVFLAAALGSGACFLLSRYAARGWIERQIGRSARFAAIDHAVAKSGLKITFLLRLSPVFPFNFMNYALGLTRVSFRDYMLASVGMLPGTLLYVYYGRLIGDVAALAGGAPGEARGAGYYLVSVLGLVATLAVTALVARIARRALDEAEGD